MKVGELSANIRLDGKPQFDRGLDDSGRRFQNLGTTAKNVAQGMATSLVVATGTMAGLGIAAFKTGVEYNALQQSTRAALTTLLGSAEAANAQMDKLDDFARNSPFSKATFIQAQQQLIGFGIAAEDVIPILGAVQDATAAVGGTNQDISDIVTTLSKISSTGKITAQDLNELGNKGIDAASLIGAEFGKSGGEIRSMITNSEITAEEAINAITTQMSVKFGGAAANVKETWVGATDRIKAAWRDTGSALAAPFVDPNGGGKAITWANDFADVLRAVQRQAAPLMDVVVTRWGRDLDRISPFLQGLKERIDALDMSALNDSLDALDGYGPIIAGLTASFAAWGSAALPIIGGINPLVAGVTALVLATPELRDGLGGVVTAAAPLLPMMGELGGTVADLGMRVIKEVAPAFIDLATAVVNAAVPLAGPLTGAITGLLQVAEPLIGVLADVVGWMADLPDEVLLAGTAFLLLKNNMGPLTGVVNAVRGAFDTLQLRRHLGAMDGMSTSATVGAAAMRNMRDAVGAVGTALKGAFITSAPALAIAGIVTVIGHFAAKSREAEQLTDDLASSFDDLTGSATDATAAIINNRLEESGTLEAYEKAGGDVRDFALALTGTGTAADEARARIDAWTDSFQDYGNTMHGVSNDGERHAGVIDGISESMSEAEERTRRLNAANADTSGTEQAISAEEELIATRERLTEVLGLEADALQSLIDKRREERGEALTLAEAQIKDAEAREKMTALIEMEGSALDATGEKFDAYSEKGQAAIEATRGVSDSMDKTAASMAAAGDGVEEITAALRDQYDSWIETAVAMGIPEEKAHELAAAYGLIPTDIATEAVLEAEGVKQTLAELQIEIDETDGTVTINGNPAPGHATLAELEGAIDNGDGTVTINGNDLPAWLTVDALIASILANDSAILDLNADKTPGGKVLDSFEGDIRAAEEFAKINATDDRAKNVLTGTARTIRQTQADMQIGANPSNLNNWVANTAGRILGQAFIDIRPTGNPSLLNRAMVDGGLLEFYADGAIRPREQHVAQIAPAGAWRVWAEPETEGEAYIPLAESKRDRSLAILAETADRFGHMVIPKGSSFHADGSVTGTGYTTAGAGLPTVLILRVGEHEFTAYLEDTISAQPTVRAVSELIDGAARRQKAGGY